MKPDPPGPSTRARSRVEVLALVAVFSLAFAARVAQVSGQLGSFEDRAHVGDLTYLPRFVEIANAPGRPYLDFPVEYPPVSLGAIELLGDEDVDRAGTRLLFLTLVCDVVVVGSLLAIGGLRAAAAYLLLTVPLLGFLYITLDLLPVALAALSIALALRRRERSAGVVAAAGVLAKVWPLVLLASFAQMKRRGALLWTAWMVAGGTLAWLLWGGLDGPVQVATQRDTPGWDHQSLVGSVLWTLGGKLFRVQESVRVGTAPGWTKALLLAAMAAGLIVVWRRGADRPTELGWTALSALCVVLACSPLLSHPYVVWLAPWAALGGRERSLSWMVLPAAILISTGLLVVAYDTFLAEEAVWSLKVLVLTRNAFVVATPLAWLLARR